VPHLDREVGDGHAGAEREVGEGVAELVGPSAIEAGEFERGLPGAMAPVVPVDRPRLGVEDEWRGEGAWDRLVGGDAARSECDYAACSAGLGAREVDLVLGDVAVLEQREFAWSGAGVCRDDD
jgi:hypothetical protein